MSENRVVESIQIDAPPERVWELIMDPRCLARWVTIHRKLGKAPPGTLDQGDELVQTLCLRGANFKVRWTVAELEAPRLAVWEGRGPARSKARTAYRLSADGNGGTRFDYENEFKAPLGPLGAAASRALVGGLPAREAKASLQRLKALLES